MPPQTLPATSWLVIRPARREHLRGRPAGEGQQQDALGRHPLVDQVGHPGDQGPGLARAGPGHDQQAGHRHAERPARCESFRLSSHFAIDRTPAAQEHSISLDGFPTKRGTFYPLTGAEWMIGAPKRLLVVIPALNEAATIGRVVRTVPRCIPGVSDVVIVVIDDGSTDGTADIACQAGAKVVRHGTPQGVGAVFHRALDLVIEEAADVLVFIDGDGQFNAADIPKVIGPILAGEADFVSASRYHEKSPPQRQTFAKRFGNWGMSRLVSRLIGWRICDAACGFRAYSADVVMNMNLTGRFTYTQETILDIAFKRFRIREVPVRVRGTRRHGKSRVARSLLKYALSALTIIVRVYRDYKPLRFFGLLALLQIVVATCLAGFFCWHYLQKGKFTPYLSVGLLAGFLYMMGALTCLTGLLADMFARTRMSIDKLLYYERQRRHEARRAELAEQAPVADRSGDVTAGNIVRQELLETLHLAGRGTHEPR